MPGAGGQVRLFRLVDSAGMDYMLVRINDRKAVDALDAHVFARAYAAAWRAPNLCEPVGQHVFETLGLEIDFGPCGRRRH